jgi:enamine deaminase RidA (YjgF/YER057c/UK114 family)
MSAENRLRELGIVLPVPPAPVAAYVPVVQTGNLAFVSGQGPVRDGKPVFVGRLGAELSLEQGQEAARLAMLNCLAQLKAHLGSLDRVRRIVKVLGFVAGTDQFDQQPYVINGGSQLLEQVFAEAGRHARSAIGTNRLPFGIPVEIELIAEVG